MHGAKSKKVGILRSTFSENIIRVIPSLDFNMGVARVYAGLYSEALMNKKRSKLNVHDLQIAATALTHNYALATKNIDDFKHISGLILEPFD